MRQLIKSRHLDLVINSVHPHLRSKENKLFKSAISSTSFTVNRSTETAKQLEKNSKKKNKIVIPGEAVIANAPFSSLTAFIAPRILLLYLISFNYNTLLIASLICAANEIKLDKNPQIKTALLININKMESVFS